MPEQFVTHAGQPEQQQIVEALRKQGIHNVEDLARGVIQQAQAHKAAGAEAMVAPEFWIVYNDGKWGLCGPS